MLRQASCPFARAGIVVLLLVLLAYSTLIYLRIPAYVNLRPNLLQTATANFTKLASKGKNVTANFLIPQDRQEAAQMQAYLSSRPNLLKAAICILVQTRRVEMLKHSLQVLHKNFNHRFGYPILLFHEADFMPLRDQLRKNMPGPLFFQMIKFQLPEFYERRFGSAEIVKICPWSGSLGYRHMCYFFSKGFFEQPSLSDLEFYWRLDDDSVIGSPFTTDPFRALRDAGAEYGYLQMVFDSALCTYNLWNVTRVFFTEHNVRPSFYYQIPEHLVFFNNFEVSRLRFWRSLEFQSFINVIDQHAGSFRYRWGDAPIRTLALSVFIKPEKIVKFTDLEYHHGNPNIPPRMRPPILEQKIVSAKLQPN